MNGLPSGPPGTSLFLGRLSGIQLIQLREWTIILFAGVALALCVTWLLTRNPKRIVSCLMAAALLCTSLVAAYPVLYWSPAATGLRGWQGVISPFLLFAAVVYALMWLMLLLVLVVRSIIHPELTKHLGFKFGKVEFSQDIDNERIRKSIEKADAIASRDKLLKLMGEELIKVGSMTYRVENDDRASAIRFACESYLNRAFYMHYGAKLDSIVHVFVLPLLGAGETHFGKEVASVLEGVLNQYGNTEFFCGVIRNIGISICRPDDKPDAVIIIEGSSRHLVDEAQVYLAAAAFLMYVRCTA